MIPEMRWSEIVLFVPILEKWDKEITAKIVKG